MSWMQPDECFETEDQVREIAILLASAIGHLHSKKLVLGILNPWNICFDERAALHIDTLWCLNKQLQYANLDKLDSRLTYFIGSHQPITQLQKCTSRRQYQNPRIGGV